MCPLQRSQAVLRYTVFHMVTRERLTSITSWPDDLPSGNQKRFWRDPVKRAGQTIWIVDAHRYDGNDRRRDWRPLDTTVPMMTDFGFAFRQLLKMPGFTFVALIV
jgi:hypothetical protein